MVIFNAWALLVGRQNRDYLIGSKSGAEVQGFKLGAATRHQTRPQDEVSSTSNYR